jgi:transcriptional regulator with XRE-family HTH domain
MPQVSRLDLPPIDLGSETIGERIALFRKEKGMTQIQLAEKIGLTQGLISAYEKDTRKLTAEMVARFALALGKTTDAIIGLKPPPEETTNSLRIMKRVQKIETLSKHKQKQILAMLDSLIRDAESNS